MEGESGKRAGQAEDTLIRERLAYVRTVLANERTLLSYIRSGLGFLAAGATALHFIESTGGRLLGGALLGLGIVCALLGLLRFRSVRKRLTDIMGTL